MSRSCPYQAQHVRCAHISGVYGGPQPFSLDVGLDVALGNIHLCSIALFVCHLLAWKEALVLLSWGALLEGSSACLATGAGGPVTVCTDHRGSVWMCERTEASGTGLVAPHNSSSGVAAAPAPDLRMVHCSFLSSRAGSPSLDSPICVATASRKLKPSLQLYWLRQAERTTRKYCNREHGIDKPCKWQ